ncbi:hypothetical protein CK203_000885 [Vitis vinifera]|uniref:Uncharacterized protein n=1 Tax=Vitis vinifera TaxID=29760 RepID=A0A438KQI2_VITVI|nr:hypothetical protein CK203_000885 [Vitis vinifera]
MRRLDDLEAKGVQEVQIVNERVTQLCLICKSTEHGVQSCPTLLIVQDMFLEQTNALGTYKQYSSNSPYSNTYNPGWRNHPNLSWNEVTMVNFSSKETNFRVIRLMGSKVFNHKKQDKRNDDQNRINAQTSQELVDIQTTLSQLAAAMPVYAKFLKDLCTMKRMIKLSKKAFLTEQVSAIIENKAMLSFGNMTVEMNVFNLCKQPMNHDDVENEEASLMEALVQEHTENLMEENIDDFSLQSLRKNVLKLLQMERKMYIQSLNNVENDEETKEEIEINKPELKPLPHGLKYVYLEKNEEKSVVILATLTEEQEIKLLKQVKTEESYEESWAKLRSHFPRVNPDCKEKKQRESARKHILDDSRVSPSDDAPIYAARRKLGTSRWKPTSQPCEDNLVLRKYFAALLSVCEISQTPFFSCEMVPEASRYLLPTLGDIFH